MAGPILLCYDGSESSREAIRRVGELLAEPAAVCLCVWEAAGEPRSALETFVEVLGTSAEEYNRLAGRAAQDTAEEGARLAGEAGFDAIPLSTAVQGGSAAEAIIRVAEERQAAAIVLGFSGGARHRRRVLGGVANAVLHGTNRPVVVVSDAGD